MIPLQEALMKEGFTVYTLNFSGHTGVPFASAFGIETFAEDVSQFVNKNNISKIDIFGYSMGGYVACWLALNKPSFISKIVTLGTKFDWSEESALKEVHKLDPEKILVKVPAFARILEHRHAPSDWKILMQKTSAMMLGLGSQPLLNEGEFKRISHDVLILQGDKDDMADEHYSEHVSKVLPHGNFHLLKDTPHPIEKVELSTLVRHIAGFIRSEKS